MAPGTSDRPELIWPGKYTESGALNQPDPPVPVPVVVERIPGPGGAPESGPDRWRNKLYLGDNLLAMTALLGELEGRFELIYIDPPFATGGTFNHRVPLGEGGRGAPVLTQQAYRDYFGAGARSYLQVMACRLRLMHRLLSDQGTLYVHCDWRVDAGLRLLLDEIFGAENFRSKLVWKKDAVGKGAKKIARHWPRTFDEILVYSKSERAYYEPQLGALGPVQLAEFRYQDPDGRRFKRTTLGDYSAESIRALEAAGRIYTSSSGKKYKKYYLDEYTLLQDAMIVDVPGFGVASSSPERLGYDTQKPEALLEKIVRASSPAGGLVGDFFCGSGTTLAVAARLGRRFVGCDLGRLAVHTARKRLLTAGACFDVLRLEQGEARAAPLAGAEIIAGEAEGTRVALLIDNRGAAPSAMGAGEVHGASWADYIDAWAVDWDYRGVFVSRWSACRMPGRPGRRALPLRSAPWPAAESGGVAVLVLDVFGEEALLVLGSGDARR